MERSEYIKFGKSWLIDKRIFPYESKEREFIEMAIKALSQPEIIHCKDCKYYEEFTDSISSKATKGCTLYYVEKDEQGFCDEAERRLS